MPSLVNIWIMESNLHYNRDMNNAFVVVLTILVLVGITAYYSSQNGPIQAEEIRLSPESIH